VFGAGQIGVAEQYAKFVTPQLGHCREIS